MAEQGSSAAPGGRLPAGNRDAADPELDQAIETLTGRLQALMVEVAALWDQLQGHIKSRRDPSATRAGSPAAQARVAEGYGWPQLRHHRSQAAASVGTAPTARTKEIAAVLRDRERLAGRRWWDWPYPRWAPISVLAIAAILFGIVFSLSGDGATPSSGLSEPLVGVPGLSAIDSPADEITLLPAAPASAAPVLSAGAFAIGAAPLSPDTTSPDTTSPDTKETAVTYLPTAALTSQPSVTTWRVQQGDKLSVIALQFGTSVETLVALNGLANPDFIRLGQELLIPVATVTQSAGSEDSP